ncbi:MAG: rhomboid family intramembrane serine protease [Myxococcota bacterium]|nr:rhomboid family intramembrane serine protease [Myxococcota bacterium]
MASLTGNRVPLITGALAVLLVAASVWPTATPEGAAIHAERTREEALEFYRGHRAVTLTAGDRILIGSEYADYIDGRRTDGAAGRPSAAARARSQAQFDALADEAREARSEVSRAWRFAVNPGDPVSSKFFAYAFFHNEAFAFALSLAFLVVAGAGLEAAWGSLLFALFCFSAVFVSAFAQAGFAPQGDPPLAGMSGLLSALLVAYLIRGWGGRFLVPGWLLLPLWFFAEYVVVRGAYLDRVEGLPLAAHAAGLGVGVFLVAGFGALGLERRRAERSDPSRSSENPALALARRALADGQHDAAWSALSRAAEEDPKDDALAHAWWRLACDQDRAGEVVQVILLRIRAELRGGDLDQALGYWFEIVQHAPQAQVEARMTTRLAESLLERGEAAGAREALRWALEDSEGLTTALAQRVVRSARDLDPKIAEAAARVALADAQLDPDSREELESLVRGGSSPLAEAGEPVSVSEGDGVLDLDQPVEPERLEVASGDESEIVELDSPEGVALALAGVEGEAFDPPVFEEASFEDLGLVEDEPGTEPELAPLLLDDSPGLSLESLGGEGAEGLSGEREAWEEPGEFETLADPSSDLHSTPALDPTLNPTSDFSEALASEGLNESDLIDATILADADLLDAEALEAEALEGEEPLIEADEALPLDPAPGGSGSTRSAKVLDAVPLAMGAEFLEVEIVGRGRGRIPYGRVEALAVGAVAGLSARPVLVLDLVLNWTSELDEPLKVIRLRGNDFDPIALVPQAASPLEALKQLITTLAQGSAAECLPSPSAVAGEPFRRFEGLAEFEAETLGITP